MKTTAYNFLTNSYIFSGYYVAFFLLLSVIFAPYIYEINTFEIKYLEIALYVFILTLHGSISGWIHPTVKASNDGLTIIRFFVITRTIKWDNVEIKNKVRTITRLGLIGLDPRYALIKIKDAYFYDRHIIILPFFSSYDDFIRTIESSVKKFKREA